MASEAINNITWAQLQRLKFIERQLLWGRGLKARMLVDSFGISRHQANKDIRLYSATFPGNLKPYDPIDRSHRPMAGFKPELIKGDPFEVMHEGGFTMVEGSEVNTVPLIQRRVVEGVIPTVLAAIDDDLDIEVIYASSSTPVGRRRRMHPKIMIFAGNRLHVRAYCYENEEYRDFVLSRIQTKPKPLKLKMPLPNDYEFDSEVEISLFVNPSLSKDGQDLIKREYKLLDEAKVKVRKCLVQYFLQDNALPASQKQLNEAQSSPWAFPVISNFKEFW